MADSPDNTLTYQQQRFCLEYIVDYVGTNAAIRSGYSQHSAAQEASRLLSIDKIAAEVNRLKKEQAERLKLTSDTIIVELFKVAKIDIREAFTDKGTLKDIKSLPDDIARLISSVEVVEEFDGVGENRTWTGYTKKVKFWDKMKALELLAKHLNLLTDKKAVVVDLKSKISDASVIEISDRIVELLEKKQ